MSYLRQRLFLEADQLPPWDGSDLDQALIAQPFVLTGGGRVVVATPFELMVTLRYVICLEATEHACQRLLHEALAEHATRMTRHICLPLFDNRDPEVKTAVGLGELDGIFDTDKMLDIRIHVPSLETPTNAVLPEPYCAAPPPARTTDGNTRVLTVDVVWPLGRDLILLSPNEPRHLCTSFRDLETILYTSGTDQLSLWYFAEALDRLADNDATVMHGGLADLYGLFDENDQSFYLSDDHGAPTTLVVESDYGATLRRKVAQRLGRTYVHIANFVHEAVLVHGAATPVREVLALPRIIFGAETSDLIIWVELQASSSDNRLRMRSLAETFCYWLVRIYGIAPELFAEFDSDLQVVLVQGNWSDDQDDKWIRRGQNVVGKDVVFEFKTPPNPTRGAPPNTLDREIVREVLSELQARLHPAQDSSARVDQFLEGLVPPGERRMLHVVQSDVDQIAWPGDLPTARTVEPAIVAKLLDDLGNHLRGQRGYAIGNLPNTQRTRVLNDEIVPFFGDQLMSRLTAYDGIALLQYLIRANEALLREGYVESARYPSRLACFGRDSDEAQRLAKRLSDGASASVSSRFLIELAAAVQPTSVGAPTTEGYDFLLGLASEVVNKGFLSDAIHAGLSHADLSILPSGRLGIGRDDDRYTKGLQSLLVSNAVATIDDAAQRSNWAPADSDAPDDDLSLADKLATTEWGFSFTEIALFTSELVNLSVEAEQEDVGFVQLEAAHQRISSKFAWPADKVNALVDQLSMTREDDFWALGVEAFPWRYNRDRSYLRRPLIVCSYAGTDYFLFGHRNALRTSFEWHGRYVSGRLQATTPEMKAALSAALELKGDRFEQQVAAELLERCDPVRRRVRKFGSHDLRDIDGRDLGDIDLLAFHPLTRTLFVLEAKALTVARTPREMRNELSNLMEGESSAVERLRLRYEWVCTHIPDVLQTLGVAVGPVRVCPAVVIDADLITARFGGRFRIIPVNALAALFEQF